MEEETFGRALALPSRPRGAKYRFAIGLVVLVGMMGLTAACNLYAPSLSPAAPLRSVAGYASLKFNGENASGRSKVSFSIQLPDRARLDVFDVLGRSILTMIVRGEESYFALIPEKAYWRGGRDEVFEKFLGFPLSLGELADILAWRYHDLPPDTLVTVVGEGVIGISLRGATFEAKTFFPGTETPHILDFRGGQSAGSLKILEIKFNGRPSERSFEPRFLDTFAAKTWPEMEELLRHEAEVVR